MKTTRTSIAVLMIVAGCHSTAWERPEAADTEALAAERFRPLGEFDIPGSSRFIGESADAVAARMGLLDAVMDHVEEVSRIMETESAWGERSRRIGEVLDAGEVTPYHAWFVDQLAASMVLEEFVNERARTTLNDDAFRLAGTFVELLVERSSPNAPLIAATLDILDGHLPSEEVRRLAAMAATHASDYLESCPSCKDADSTRLERPGAGREARLIAAGRIRLLEIARASSGA